MPSTRRRPALRALPFALAATWAGITLLTRHGAAEAQAREAPAAAAPTALTRHHPAHGPVVTLYGEALCPDTAAWVTRVLGPAVDAGLIGPGRRRQEGGRGDDADDDDGVEVPSHRRPPATFRYVGYGNAVPGKDGALPTCQHGPPECRLDAALNCADALLPRPVSFDLLLCYFRAVEAKGTATAAKDPALIAGCAAEAGIRDWDRVLACAAGERGAALAAKAGVATAALDPRKTFVPWVLVEGQAMCGECGALVERVCERVVRRAPVCEAPPVPTPACPGAPRKVGVV